MKSTFKLSVCDKCGALVGDTPLHKLAAHPTAPKFYNTIYEIEIPVKEIEKYVVKQLAKRESRKKKD